MPAQRWMRLVLNDLAMNAQLKYPVPKTRSRINAPLKCTPYVEREFTPLLVHVPAVRAACTGSPPPSHMRHTQEDSDPVPNSVACTARHTASSFCAQDTIASIAKRLNLHRVACRLPIPQSTTTISDNPRQNQPSKPLRQSCLTACVAVFAYTQRGWSC